MKLTDLNTIKSVLSEVGAAPDKKFGQNFLISERVVAAIAENCGASAEDGILEIGPGLGTLSRELCGRYAKVVAVEIDGKMTDVLALTMKDADNFTVINQDIMKTDIKRLVSEQFGEMNVTVCANLPYYITSPVIMALLESGAGFDNVTVMIQKEVAARLTAKPGTPDYGAITPAVEYRAEIKRLFTVPAGCFYPAPKVDSAVIRMKIRKTPPVDPRDKELMFEIIRASFMMRRKTLSNAVSSVLGISRDTVCGALNDCGLDAAVRGEALSLYDFSRLSDAIKDRL
ncbi:MAG: 16S rRNA (adenine(1518)-N(6)/adenine(1519)-N(6))-dimethyltransferase RsmA [Clostridia bacterium]|nr:16S rRNA (adenine(1518)-N(6)/adenine(1519)-N(6))-dimethyltransferase RsmA [Clostridia bacterium]